MKTFFIALYVGTSFVAVTGNILVIYVIIFKRVRTVTNMYIANLALADVIIGLFAIPFQFQAILLQRWTLPAFLCKELFLSIKLSSTPACQLASSSHCELKESEILS